MPRTKTFAANAGSAEVNAMVERVAPDVLELLADGVPRTKPAIVAALAGRHAEDEVEPTLVRLDGEWLRRPCLLTPQVRRRNGTLLDREERFPRDAIEDEHESALGDLGA